MFRRFVVSLSLHDPALLAVAALAITLAAAPPAARASCGSESCPLDKASHCDESQLSFELSQQYIDQDQPRVGTNATAVGAIPAEHDEVRTVNRITTARAAYRPSQAWAFSAALPFVNRTHEHIHNHLGMPEYQRWSYAHVGDLEALALRRFTALALTALILAAHLPLLAARQATARTMACCGPKSCCQPERACTSGGACATHTDHAAAPIDRTLPTLLAGNCGDPTPRVVPVSYDPVTPPSATAVRAETAIAALPAATAPTAPVRDTAPSVPPPRA